MFHPHSKGVAYQHAHAVCGVEEGGAGWVVGRAPGVGSDRRLHRPHPVRLHAQIHIIIATSEVNYKVDMIDITIARLIIWEI